MPKLRLRFLNRCCREGSNEAAKRSIIGMLFRKREIINWNAEQKKLTIFGPDNKTAVISFKEGVVTYSGDLSVDVSAKRFFEALRIMTDDSQA